MNSSVMAVIKHLDSTAPHSSHGNLSLLAMAALGIFYGDTGTSPLYTVKECFSGIPAVPPAHGNVLGVLSMFFWALLYPLVALTTIATIIASQAMISAVRGCR